MSKTEDARKDRENQERMVALFRELQAAAAAGTIAGCGVAVLTSDGEAQLTVAPGRANQILLLGTLEMMKNSLVKRIEMEKRPV